MNHFHPIFIVHCVIKYFPFALLPVLAGILSAVLGGEFLSGALLRSAAILFFIALLSFIYWSFSVWSIADGELVISKGIFIKRRMEIPLRCIRYICAETELLSVFGGLRVHIDTNTFSRNKHNFSVLLSKRQFLLLRKSIFAVGRKSAAHRVRLGKSALLSLAASSSASGWLMLSPVLSLFRKLLDTPPERYIYSGADRFARVYLGALPPLMGIAALLLFVGWLISFLANLQRFSAMRIAASGDIIFLRAGFIFPRSEAFSLRSDCTVCCEKGLLGCILSFFDVRCMLSGFEKGKGRGVLLPALSTGGMNLFSKKRSDGDIAERAWYKLIILPLLLTVCIILLCFYISLIYSAPRAAALLLSIIAALLFAAKIALAFYEMRYCKIALTDNGLFFAGRYKGRLCAILPKGGHCTFTIKRTPFQKKDGTCTIKLKIMSGSGRAFRLRHTVYAEAGRLFLP